MGWATAYIDKLKKGEAVSFRPRGNSMTPKIKSGDIVSVIPFGVNHLPTHGDIVLCKVNGQQYLHLIIAIRNGRFQIANNHGHITGWCGLDQIYGKVASVTP